MTNVQVPNINVQVTNILKNKFSTVNLDLEQFTKLFFDWKSAGVEGWDNFYEFGKDVSYETPHVNGKKNVLMHVHLVPILDTVQKSKWDRNWERCSNRTSNRSLVYVNDNNTNFLLIDILPEPYAHEIPRMTTPEHKQIMGCYADIAEKFIYHKIVEA